MAITNEQDPSNNKTASIGPSYSEQGHTAATDTQDTTFPDTVSEPADYGLEPDITNPVNEPVLTPAGYEPPPKSRKRLIAGGAAALLAVGAAYFLTQGDKGATTKPVAVAESGGEGSASAGSNNGVLGGENENSSGETGANLTYGLVQVAELKPGEPFITVARANGDEIRVPRLRNTSDLDEFGSSAVGLLACYFTTGSQECLDEFSTNDEVQASLGRVRQDVYLNPVANAASPVEEDFQIVIFDRASNPTQFIRSAVEPGQIVQAGGPVYVQLSDDPNWQGLNMFSEWYGLQFSQLEFRVDESGPRPQILGMRYAFTPSQSQSER